MRKLNLFGLGIAILLLLPMHLAFGSAQGSSDEEWLTAGLAAQMPRYERVTFRPHPRKRGVVAANCERQIEWGGELRVFRRTGDHVDWIAALPDEYAKNFAGYVLGCEWRYLPKLHRWVLEVFDSTHKGNGDLWLFALDGQELRVLLRAKAAGQVWRLSTTDSLPNLHVPEGGEARFQEDHLKAAYPAAGKSKSQTVVLSGTVVVRDGEGRRVARKRYTERWIWSAGEGRFKAGRPLSLRCLATPHAGTHVVRTVLCAAGAAPPNPTATGECADHYPEPVAGGSASTFFPGISARIRPFFSA